MSLQTMPTGILIEHYRASIVKLEALRRSDHVADSKEFKAAQKEVDRTEEEVLRRMAW